MNHKTNTCLIIKLSLLLILMININNAGSLPDYGSSENEQLYTSSEVAADDHEIYDPAQLQQEVEDEEELMHKPPNLVDTGHTAYYDSSQEDTTNMMMLPPVDDRDDATIKISRTTMVPEYVRRQKSYEHQHQNQQHSSTEDYDDSMPTVSSSGSTSGTSTSTSRNTSSEEVDEEEDHTAPADDINYMDIMTGPIELTQRNESVPLAMKSNVLYSDENDLHDIQNQQPLHQQHQHQSHNHHYKHKHHQQLENSNSSAEEEYYEDAPESIEELYPSSLLGTTTINAPPPLPPLLTTTPPSSPMPSPSSSQSQQTTTESTPQPSLLPVPFGTASADPASTTLSTSTATMMTTSRGAKQGKQIHIARRKLLPHEQLRNYIEDAYIRMPLAVIVDPSPESLDKTKALWREALRSNFAIKIVLVALNASGTPTAYSFNNTRQFLAGLNSIKESSGGDAFIGVVHASELVPYDSAVFISTASIPAHTELVQDAAITLLKKRIRLYLVWYGERLETENETQEAVGGILGEVAIRSGGEILHVVGNETYQEIEGMTLTMIADTYLGSQEIDIPVDTTLSSLHVKIDSLMRTATLETPNGG